MLPAIPLGGGLKRLSTLIFYRLIWYYKQANRRMERVKMICVFKGYKPVEYVRLNTHY